MPTVFEKIESPKYCEAEGSGERKWSAVFCVWIYEGESLPDDERQVGGHFDFYLSFTLNGHCKILINNAPNAFKYTLLFTNIYLTTFGNLFGNIFFFTIQHWIQWRFYILVLKLSESHEIVLNSTKSWKKYVYLYVCFI